MNKNKARYQRILEEQRTLAEGGASHEMRMEHLHNEIMSDRDFDSFNEFCFEKVYAKLYANTKKYYQENGDVPDTPSALDEATIHNVTQEL